MTPMERTFREVSESFGNDVEFGPELKDRIRENRQVDEAPGPLVAAAQRRTGEVVEQYSKNNTLHPGTHPESITALKEPEYQSIISNHSRKTGLGIYPVDAINIITRQPRSLFGPNPSEKTELGGVI